MLNEKIKPSGQLHIVHTDENGEVVEYDYKNLVVTAGRVFIANRMVNDAVDPMNHMALGSGNTAPIISDETLEDEIGRVEMNIPGGVHSANTVTYSGTFGPGVATGPITEAGIFNANIAGSMLCRTVFPVINKQAADTIAVTWIVSII